MQSHQCMTEFFDTHAHLDFPAYAEDLEAVVERASLAGVIASLAAVPGRGPSVARVGAQAVDFLCK